MNIVLQRVMQCKKSYKLFLLVLQHDVPNFTSHSATYGDNFKVPTHNRRCHKKRKMRCKCI